MNIGFHRFVGFPQKLIDPNCSYVVILFYGAYCCLEIDCNTDHTSASSVVQYGRIKLLMLICDLLNFRIEFCTGF